MICNEMFNIFPQINHGVALVDWIELQNIILRSVPQCVANGT